MVDYEVVPNPPERTPQEEVTQRAIARAQQGYGQQVAHQLWRQEQVDRSVAPTFYVGYEGGRHWARVTGSEPFPVPRLITNAAIEDGTPCIPMPGATGLVLNQMPRFNRPRPPVVEEVLPPLPLWRLAFPPPDSSVQFFVGQRFRKGWSQSLGTAFELTSAYVLFQIVEGQSPVFTLNITGLLNPEGTAQRVLRLEAGSVTPVSVNENVIVEGIDQAGSGGFGGNANGPYQGINYRLSEQFLQAVRVSITVQATPRLLDEGYGLLYVEMGPILPGANFFMELIPTVSPPNSIVTIAADRLPGVAEERGFDIIGPGDYPNVTGE